MTVNKVKGSEIEHTLAHLFIILSEGRSTGLLVDGLHHSNHLSITVTDSHAQD